MQLSFVVVVALAGSVGAVCRHVLAGQVTALCPDLPLGTAVVNVVGCLAFGFCWALAQGRWSPLVATAVFVGFFGAFTTFSSLAFECHELLAAGRPWLFAANLVGQNVLGLLAIAAGLSAGGWVRAE